MKVQTTLYWFILFVLLSPSIVCAKLSCLQIMTEIYEHTQRLELSDSPIDVASIKGYLRGATIDAAKYVEDTNNFVRAAEIEEFINAFAIAPDPKIAIENARNYVAAIQIYGWARKYQKARQGMKKLREIVEEKFNAPLNITDFYTRFSRSHDARYISSQVEIVLPYLIIDSDIRRNNGYWEGFPFNTSSPRACRSMCVEYSDHLKFALNLIGVDIIERRTDFHKSLTYGNLIIDPSIQQIFSRSPKMRGIFIGTRQQLVKLILGNIDLLDHAYLTHPETGGSDIDSLLRNWWKINRDGSDITN